MSKSKKRGLKISLIVGVLIIGIGSTLFISRYGIAKVVKDIPVLNQIFKEKENQDDPYAVLTKEELKEQIISLEKSLQEATLTIGNLENDKVLLNEKIDSLKQYEVQYNEFLAQKSKWDEEVARTNPELFIEQFESFYPDVATRVFEELKGESYLKKEQIALANIVGQMDSVQAAQKLTQLMKTDPELVKVILKSMKKESQAEILNEVDTAVGAQMIKLISP